MQCVYPRGQTSKYISRCYINTQYMNIRKYIRLSHYLHVIWKLTFLGFFAWLSQIHYNDVIMGAMASQITSLTMACPAVYSMHRSKKTLKPRVTGLCVCGPVNSSHKGPVTRKMFWWRHYVLPVRQYMLSFSQRWDVIWYMLFLGGMNVLLALITNVV